MKNLRRAEDILIHFSKLDLDNESRIFLHYHYQRYEYLFGIVDRYFGKLSADLGERPVKILDIGPGFQTEILRQTIPGAIVNTLGFEDSRFIPRSRDQHYQFDLNKAQYEDQWLTLEHHDLIILAEVIEHLYTSPSLVLKCVATWMESGGYLILQTPNACALHKRLITLAGRNPYDLIRENPENPGHFREYTLSELMKFANDAGFQVIEWSFRNYFNNGSQVHKAYNMLSRVLPASLRQGITLVLQKI